ncbi:MAG: DUF2971 domain-containing protein [Phycisphaerae bacterium]|jgi:hypothetical protein
MNILYKYCGQLGVVKILESLELKLPYISEVNDPLECSPFLYCPKDKSAMEAQWLRTFKHNNIKPPANWEQKLNEQFEKGEIQKNLRDVTRASINYYRRKSFLLSVSQEARSTVMWAHYADKHKGAVIGIDFDRILLKSGIKMHRVTYSEQRPKINILDDSEKAKYYETLVTKSTEWTYEREFRVIFDDAYLMDLEQQGLACLKDFNGKKTWFLRLDPKSIKEIIFGLYTEDGLKLAIRKLTEQSELQHIKLYQAEESETYTLNLIEIENQQKRG